MPRRFTDRQLWQLRNEVPFPWLLQRLAWPHRRRDGQLIFVCPRCGESRSDLNPQENLVRCFHCQTNFNPIDFTMAARACDFVDAVHYLLSLTDHRPTH
jgi:CHC2 zinc finger